MSSIRSITVLLFFYCALAVATTFCFPFSFSFPFRTNFESNWSVVHALTKIVAKMIGCMSCPEAWVTVRSFQTRLPGRDGGGGGGREGRGGLGRKEEK